MAALPRAEDLFPDQPQSMQGEQTGGLPKAEDLFPDQPRPWGDVVYSALKSIPASAINAGHGIVNAALHPIDTANGGLDAIEGAAIKGLGALGIKGSPGLSDAERQQKVAAANALAQFYGDRYGSVEGFKNALASDPVGVGLDASAVLGGAGGAAGLAGLSKTARALGAASTAIDPIAAPLSAAAWAGGKMMPSANRIYGSAIKASTTLPEKVFQKITDAGIAEKIYPTGDGYKKLQGIISEGGDEANRLAAEAAANGVSASTFDLAASRDPIINRPVNDSSALNGVIADKMGFLDTWAPFHELGMDRDIPIDVVHSLKKDAQDVANFKQTNPNSSNYDNAGWIAHSSALRQAVEDAVPGVAEINQRISPLMQLRPEIERALGRERNSNALGLSAPVMAGAAAASGLGAVPAAIVGSGTRLMGLPAAKAAIAFRLAEAEKIKNFLSQYYIPGSTTRYPYVANALATSGQDY